MMLGCVEVIIAEVLYAAAAEQEFERKLSGLDPRVAAEIRKERKESQEKARAEAAVERRHQELCRAIERSGFWSIIR